MIKYVFDNITTLFQKIKKYPNQTEECVKLIKSSLNKHLTTKTMCDRIFVSNNGLDPFYALVVPSKYPVLRKEHVINHNYDVAPDNKAGNIIKRNPIPDSYQIDLDINPLLMGEVTPREMTAWLIHEVSHNVLTVQTKLRILGLLYEYVGIDLIERYAGIIMNAIGNYFWLDIHGRTGKDAILEEHPLTYEADRLLLDYEYYDEWNSILKKYINAHGGDPKIVTPENIDKKDRLAMRMMNQLIREMRVPRDVIFSFEVRLGKMIEEYVSRVDKNSLLSAKLLSERDTIDDWMLKNDSFNEKDVFCDFDDTKLMNALRGSDKDINEESVMQESIAFWKNNKPNYNKYYRQLETIGFEIEDMRNIDDKIYLAGRLQSIREKLQKVLEKDAYDERAQQLMERTMTMVATLRETKLKERSYGVFVQGVPQGYEG